MHWVIGGEIKRKRKIILLGPGASLHFNDGFHVGTQANQERKMPYPFFSERKEKAFFFKETRTYIKQREINLRAGEGGSPPKEDKRRLSKC